MAATGISDRLAVWTRELPRFGSMATFAHSSSGAPEENEIPRMIAEWLIQRGILRTTIVVGVSGGADSVALLRGLHACRLSHSLSIIVAHLDHGLREESAAESSWVAALAEQLGVPAIVERTDVTQAATDSGQGIEETARQRRYEFFRSVAERQGGTYVGVAHTSDDQAETVLHHLVRGTGLSGLQGMPAMRALSPDVTLIRPLLDTSRETVIGYLNALGQDFRIDESNSDEQFTRNRIRQTLLPLLREKFNPQVDRALLRLSQQASEVQEMLDILGRNALYGALREQRADRVQLNADVLRDVPPHLLREVFRQLWAEQSWPRQRMGFDMWQRLANLVQSPEPAKSISLPGDLTARREGSMLRIFRSTDH